MRRLFVVFTLSLSFVSCQEMVEKEADEKIALAEEALHEQDWELADESFHEAILLDPDRAESWIGRGMTLTQLGEKEKARVHYEEALELGQKRLEEDPLAPEWIQRHIMLLVLLDRNGEAAALAEETAQNHPNREFGRNLPKLVEEMNVEFKEMILEESDEQPWEGAPLE